MIRAPQPAHRRGDLAKRASYSRQWKLLIAACILSGLIIWFGGGPITWVLAHGFLTATAVAVVRADLMHPYTWYAPVFCLYSTFYPLLVGVQRWIDIGFLHEVCLLQWLALVTFLIVVGPARRPVVPPLNLLKRLAHPSWPVYWASAGIAVICFWYLRESGFTSKLELALSRSLIVSLGGPAYSVLALAFAAILASGLASRRIPYVAIVITFLISVAGVLIAGERDVFFRIILVSVFLVHAIYRRIKAKEFAFLLLIGVLLLAVSGLFRNLMMSDRPKIVEIDDPVERILGGEFVSAGWNLDGLIDEMEGEDYFWGETLWWDVKRVFMPGFLGYSSTTPGRWFNERRFPLLVAYGGGRGFTIVGEGYMNFGAVGVVIWFTLLGFMIKCLYAFSGRSAFWFLTYVVSTTLFLYVIREDFAALFSQALKHIVFPLLVIHATAHVIEKLGLQQTTLPVSAKARST